MAAVDLSHTISYVRQNTSFQELESFVKSIQTPLDDTTIRRTLWKLAVQKIGVNCPSKGTLEHQAATDLKNTYYAKIPENMIIKEPRDIPVASDGYKKVLKPKPEFYLAELQALVCLYKNPDNLPSPSLTDDKLRLELWRLALGLHGLEWCKKGTDEYEMVNKTKNEYYAQIPSLPQSLAQMERESLLQKRKI